MTQMFNADDIKEFYAKLQDDESRYIFNKRLLYFLDGDDKHLWEMVFKIYPNHFSREIAELIQHKQSGKKIVLYGAGTVGRCAKTFFECYGLTADAFCDKNPDKQKNGYMGSRVISLQTLAEKYKDAVVVITASNVYAHEIVCELNDLGFDQHVYDFFVHYEITDYFDYDFLKPVKNEIYIDCGVLNGGTIKTFSDFTNGKYSKIFGFEPDAKSFDRTSEYMHEQKIERVEMISKGVWSKKTVLSFSAKGDGGSHISDSGTVKVPVTTIDESVGDDMVTFIKMDIEGAELEALRGASKTIKRCKPRLAICVYHKPEDILEIPLYIQSLIPDYRYFLRHAAISEDGTILYCVK